MESLDLSAIENAIHEKDPRGERPYHPRMMLALLLYGAMGFRRFSMRGLAKALGEWFLVCTSHNLRKLWAAQVSFGG